jgi:hypothetical protein
MHELLGRDCRRRAAPDNRQTTVRAGKLDVTKNRWSAGLLLPPGKYDCWEVLLAYDAKLDKTLVLKSEKKVVTISRSESSAR